MKLNLVRSTAFVRAARRSVKRNPQFAPQLSLALKRLSEDAFHPLLRSHKLKGALQGKWAARVNYDLRIIFRFVEHEGKEAILLLTLGSHDEVY